MGTRGTILLVEGDPNLAALLREVLGDEGYRVLIAPTIADGLDILAALRVELVITDALHPAPTTERWAALDPLARAAGTTPLILRTAHSTDQCADYAAHGFAAHLPAPLDLDDLLALIRSLLPDSGRPLPGTEAAIRALAAPCER